VTNIIKHCELFVMPSLYEGFGFPVLEAQAQGVPVACSNSGALPEITGNSAELFDPRDVDDIAASILRCLVDQDVNKRLRTLSIENAARFSWQRTAQAYQACYAHIAEKSLQTTTT
jgi:glycosyltransferase involved in cell wall biosynthesis